MPDGSAFRAEWVEAGRGIRVGHLRPEERLTQILKFRLREIFGQDFLVDRWGRGSVWSTVWFVPRPNRIAKGYPGAGHFSSAKFYVGTHAGADDVRAGFHIESGLGRSPDHPEYERAPNWDWNRFLAALRGNDALDAELRRLVRRDGFRVSLGFFERDALAPETFQGSRTLLRAVRRMDRDAWIGVLVDYGWSDEEIQSTGGPGFVDAVVAVCLELAGVMNAALEIPLPDPRYPGEERGPG